MQRSLLFTVSTAFILGSAFFVRAEEPIGPVRFAPGLLDREQGIECSIADGRLIAKVLRFGQGNMAVQAEAADGTIIRECLELSCDEAHVRLHYEQECGSKSVVVRVMDERDWQITQRDEARGEQIVVQQPAVGPLTLTIETKLGRQHFSGPTVWHLLLGKSDACEQSLVSLLQTVQPRWDLSETLADIQDELLKADLVSLPHEVWQEHVANLSADDFAVRQQADVALRAAGRPVLRYLASLNPAELDAEQRIRIRHIRRDMATEESDGPQAAAALVRNDVGVWLNLLDTKEPEHQQHALAHAEQLLGRSPEIDLNSSTTELRAQINNAKERYSEAQLATYR